MYEKRHGEQSSISKNSRENGVYRDSAEIRNNKISDDEEGSWGLWSEEENEEAARVVEKYLRENHEKEKQEIIEFLRMPSTTDHEHGSSSSLPSPDDKKWCDLPVPVPVPSVEGGFLDESCSPSTWWN